MRKIAIFYGDNDYNGDILNKIISFFDKIEDNSLKNLKIFKTFHGFSMQNDIVSIKGFKNPKGSSIRGYKFDSIIFESCYYYEIDSDEEDFLIMSLCPQCSPNEVRVIDFDEI